MQWKRSLKLARRISEPRQNWSIEERVIKKDGSDAYSARPSYALLGCQYGSGELFGSSITIATLCAALVTAT